jgi:predicted glycogen debranching enzyme
MMNSNVTWIDQHAPQLKGKILVTLSMEGCIPELTDDAREANAKGGLGIYFGDKLEGLSFIGMDKAFGCMPLYSKRLVQSIINGKQHIEYRDVSYKDQQIRYAMGKEGKAIQFEVWGWDEENTAQERQYHIDVYGIDRGGTPLYLFCCPEVFDILYPDGKTHPDCGKGHRFLQDTVFAECVYELFKRMKIVPDILHLNEGHVADCAAILKGDKAFDKTAVVYTNHTVVPAGLEKFCIGELVGGDVARARYAMRLPGQSWQRLWRKFVVYKDGRLLIDFSKGALEISDAANGVSKEHAEITQNLFQCHDREVDAVLNGSGNTWVMNELLEMELKGLKPTKEILFRIGTEGKALSLAEVKKRTSGMTNKNGQIITNNGVLLDPSLPTVWMVRRMVEYKSQLPILKDIIHVICADRNDVVDTIWGRTNGLGMQVVVGGIVPQGCNEEIWIEEFIGWMQRPELKQRFVYVPNSDTVLLRMQAIGADICINCPQPGKEACGTSDQRSARNGGINIATNSGGPPEYITDNLNGLLVGPYESNEDFYRRAPKEILLKLRQLSDIYYNDKNMWLDMKLQSYMASPKVTSYAMEQRYSNIYVKALRTRENIIRSREMGHNKILDTEEQTNLMLRMQEGASDFLYRDVKLEDDAALKGWTIAGSPYFDHRQGQHYSWGRDTIIALPGLCLEREKFDMFRDIIKNYLRFVKNGILPRIVGKGSLPRYNSIDTSLWLFWAIGKYLDRTHDYVFLDAMIDRKFPENVKVTVRNILEEIINTYRSGIEFEERWQESDNEKSQIIRMFMDSDCLISAGNENTPLTWMDTKPEDSGPVTSRHGKAVEINALWYNALKVMDGIQKRRNSPNREYEELATNVKKSFAKFWNQHTGCLYDTIDGDPEQSWKVRPNQVFAVALGLLDSQKSRAVMDKIRKELLTPFGLRTLSLYDRDYHCFGNNEYSYHQGAVWPWLIGSFVEGCIVAYGREETLGILDGIGYFKTLSEILGEFKYLPEICDGNCQSIHEAMNRMGCKSQASSVAESLRGLSMLLFSNHNLRNEKQKIANSKVIYEIVIRDYHDAQNKISGLSAASEELPFLAKAGVEYVYLLGLMKHTGEPFDIMDSFDIDERAGSFADLDNFLSIAHSLKLKVLVDWMANQHVSKNSPLCRTHPDWFLYTDAKDGNYFADKGMLLLRGRDIQSNQKNLNLVSATDEVPLRSFPRRWSSLAQPDLSHTQVTKHAIDIGRFWLAKGLDGFRIDAALSTFPDKIKENWGLDVEDNLTRLFIEDMRYIKADCFIMFEGFERLEDLLRLANHKNCAVYNWKPRNLATEALNCPSKLPMLISYLKELENTYQIRDNLVNLGPEHDAVDFDDPWAKLRYRQKLLMHFMYSFMPGYNLVFNGDIFGRQHYYKIDPAKTSPAPRVADAENPAKETARRLFNLRNEYPQLVAGGYKILENNQNIISIARFDDNEIVIGVINPDLGAKEVVLSLDEVINDQINSSNIKLTNYTQDVVLLKNDTTGWNSEIRDNLSAESLLEEGLYIGIDPMSCQVIRLRLKVRKCCGTSIKTIPLNKRYISDLIPVGS